MPSMKTASRGMTLLELMMALTVVAILVAIAVPSFQQVTASSRTASAINDFITAVTLARSEALRRATPTRVCASANLADCSGAPDWATGWVVFVDIDNDGVVDDDELVQTFAPLGASLTATGSAASVGYNTLGMGELVGGVPFALEVTPSHCSGDGVGRTTVSLVGTPRTEKVACPS